MALNFNSLQGIYQNPPATTKPLFSTGMPVFNPNQTSPDAPPGVMSQSSSGPLTQDQWMAQQPSDTYSDPGRDPNVDYTNYLKQNTDFSNTSSLPAGFMQSEYGGAYQGVLNQFNDPNYDKAGDPSGLRAWLVNAPLQFNAHRSLADWGKPSLPATIIGGLDSATLGQLALGGFGGAAMGAGGGGGAGASSGTGLLDAGTGLPAVEAGSAPISSGAMTNAAFGGGGATTATGAGTGLIDAGTGLPAVDAGAVGGTTGGAGAGAAGAGGSALSRIIDGTATTADWTSVLGGAAGTGLGIAGSINQQNALQDLAKQQMSMGAPYRDKLAALYADPNSFLKSAEVTAPVQQGTDALARSLSVQGNPVGSGHALQEIQDYSANQLFGKLGQEKDRLAGYGGLTAYNAAAPGTALAGVNAGANVYNAVGSGIANLTNPQPSLIDLYKTMKGLA